MKPGLVKIQLTQPVEVKQLYTWTFTVKCGDPSSNPYVSSSIYIDPDNKTNASGQSLPQQKRVAFYAENGYWYDALTLAAESNSLPAEDIDSLLQSGELNNLGKKFYMLKK
jgi:Domain of Unknown Function (DUF928)